VGTATNEMNKDTATPLTTTESKHFLALVRVVSGKSEMGRKRCEVHTLFLVWSMGRSQVTISGGENNNIFGTNFKHYNVSYCGTEGVPSTILN
jgi:hypothetical protein